MNKGRIKAFVLGFLLCALLSGSVMAVASTQIRWRNANIAYGPYRIMVNGQLFEAREANGRVIDVINLDGWLFAPFEHIAAALDMPAHWDGATTTLYLGSRDGRREEMLFDRPFVEVGNAGEFTASGNAQTNNIMLRRNGVQSAFSPPRHIVNNHVTYALNALATDFKATLHPHPNADVTITYRIYGDGRLLHAPPMLLSHMAPVSIDVDVRGVRHMRIEMEMINTNTGTGNTRNMNNWPGIENARIVIIE
jgi:hypothetical protein